MEKPLSNFKILATFIWGMLCQGIFGWLNHLPVFVTWPQKSAADPALWRSKIRSGDPCFEVGGKSQWYICVWYAISSRPSCCDYRFSKAMIFIMLRQLPWIQFTALNGTRRNNLLFWNFIPKLHVTWHGLLLCEFSILYPNSCWGLPSSSPGCPESALLVV